MRRLELTSRMFDSQKVLHVVLFALMIISCLLDNYRANAATEMPTGLDAAVVEDGVAYDLRPPRRLRAKRHPTTE